MKFSKLLQLLVVGVFVNGTLATETGSKAVTTHSTEVTTSSTVTTYGTGVTTPSSAAIPKLTTYVGVAYLTKKDTTVVDHRPDHLAETSKLHMDRSNFSLGQNCSYQLVFDAISRYQSAIQDTQYAAEDPYTSSLHTQKLAAIDYYATQYNDDHFHKFKEPGSWLDLTPSRPNNMEILLLVSDNTRWRNCTLSYLGSHGIDHDIYALDKKITRINEHFHALDDLDTLSSSTAKIKMRYTQRIYDAILNDLDYLGSAMHPCNVPEKYIDIKHRVEKVGLALDGYRELNDRLQARERARLSEMSACDRVAHALLPVWNLGFKMCKTAWKWCVFMWCKLCCKICQV